jgi:hypothetical protein
VKLILKNLNPSPATAKGHMKRPRHGIKSTTPKIQTTLQQSTVPMQPVLNKSASSEQTSVIFSEQSSSEYNQHRPTLIVDDSEGSIANVFGFGAFVDKNNGIVYHDLTGSFPFMSLDGSVCFFILYHYESNSILATPIAGRDDKSIFKAYKTRFRELEAKGFKPKLNVMDNQATKHIKQFLTENECKLQLVEPHNYRVNAAERAIQTFKDAFIAALATTDSDFPLQLWDKLTPQVQDTLNMMRASRVDPTKSAYEILNGPYDWNRYPLAPLGCKAVIYEDGDTRGSWASRGVDGWYLGPSKDHYRCDLYFIPETRAYRISGSTELFPQHCQIPCFTKYQHFWALTEELTKVVDDANATTAGKGLVKALQRKIEQALNPNLVQDEQRVREDEQRVVRENQQRVVDNTPILTIPRITDAPPIMQSRNPTAKRRLHENPRIHQRVTRHNTPGGSPLITRRAKDTNNEAQGLRRLLRIRPAIALSPSPVATLPKVTSRPIPSVARQRTVTRQALNVMTIQEQVATHAAFTPTALTPRGVTHRPMKFVHYANPMVHPITGETISSYKKLMHDPATAEVWQTALGKDFGGKCQGDNKTGQKGTNAMFVMTHDEIAHALRAKRVFTYGNPVVDHRPQKEDPNRIRITAGGNLIKCDEEVSVRTADINTAKLHWNSVISTIGARYMCLDIGNIYLTAALEYFEYMKMPLALFPAWIVEQYNLKELAFNGYVHLEMRRAVWGLPQAGILANKRLRRKLAPFGYYECVNTPGLWYHVSRPISFTLVVDDFGVNFVGKEHADHLIASIKSTYNKLTEDWTGSLYCGISLDWDCVGRTATFQCRGISRKNCRNISTYSQRGYKIAHILPNQNDLE